MLPLGADGGFPLPAFAQGRDQLGVLTFVQTEAGEEERTDQHAAPRGEPEERTIPNGAPLPEASDCS